MRRSNPNKLAIWQRRVADWKQSGLNAKQWCSRENLKYSAFQYWRRALRNSEEQKAGPVFIELPVEDSPSAELGIEVAVGAARIHVQRDFDESTLVRLVTALGSCA